MPILAAGLGVLGGIAGAFIGGYVANEGQERRFEKERAAAEQDGRPGRRRSEPLRRGRCGGDRAAPARSKGRAAPVRAHRAGAGGRDAAAVEGALGRVREAARGDANLLFPLREALAAHATVGEICMALREELGTYDAHRAP
jgi:Methylmalonyl-CoA mutase